MQEDGWQKIPIIESYRRQELSALSSELQDYRYSSP
jgi:hypothetical protein